jgi:energy-coupling factor transport system permease protein
VIHSLDPRTKLLWTLFYVISLFFHHNLLGFLLSGFVFLAAAAMTNVPFPFMVRGLKSIVVILLFTLCFQVFFTSGTVLFSIGVLDVTKEGLEEAAFVAARLILLVLFSSLMTLTTTPNQLTDGLEMLCSPFKRFHVPVHEMAMMMSITLRFIPILMEELDKIMKAQQARGADFETGNIFRRIKAMVPILVPLFAAAFRRADELALAMDARCYHGGEGRTKMKPLKWGKKDAAALLCGGIYLCLVAACRKF